MGKNKAFQRSLLVLVLVFGGAVCGCGPGGNGNPALPALQIVTASLPDGVENNTYSMTVEASGGTKPYSWNLTGTLPNNVNWLQNGDVLEISGMPATGTAGSYPNLLISVSDNSSPVQSDSESYTISIYEALVIATSSLPDGVVRQSYSATLAANGGKTPYVWSEVGSNLDTYGLVLNSDGSITGSPSQTGTCNFTARVTDAANLAQSAETALSITIYEVIVITTSSLPDGVLGESYSATLAASGGKTPYVWGEVGSNLSAYGLVLNSDGSISGTATPAGTCNFTARVTDASDPQQSAEKDFSITVVDTIYVDGANGNDTNDGLSWTTAKKTIQAGLDAAGYSGWIVLVANGTYTGTGNRDLDFVGKAIDLRSVGGAAKCIIDCENSGRGFYFHSGETSSSVLEGFTITNGIAADHGGGVFCEYSSSPTITNCAISDNTAGYDGGGVSCSSSSSPTFNNCTISGNTVNGFGGGGVYCTDFTNPIFTNCTISGNTSDQYGGGVWCRNSSSPTFQNSIIWGNTANSYGHQIYVYDSNSSVTLSYSCYADGTNDVVIDMPGSVISNNCINLYPVFVDAYHLLGTSPCIDIGNNSYVPAGVTTDLDGNPRIQNGTVDIGAYEYQP